MSNVYYDPEKFGLRVVNDIDFSSGCYEFDLTVVWQDTATGKLYYADDSGCSCPSPFEWAGKGDLTQINKIQDFVDHLSARATGYYRDRDTTAERGELIQKVREAKRSFGKK